MKLLIDTANVAAIREANELGVIRGVTTNPSIIAREGRHLIEVITEISDLIDGVVFAEVISPECDKMISEAHELAKIGDNIVIKIPMCAEGLKAINLLKKEGIRTNCTLIFSAAQALLAAGAGASYVSPFVGRLDDIGSAGVGLIAEIAEIFAIHNIGCEIVAASTRSPLHVIECARAGAHNATLPPEVIRQMIDHPLTAIGLERFIKDWEDLLARL